MTKKKVFEFLLMPFVPLLRNVVSFRVLFIPEIILSVFFALVLLIFDKYLDLQLSFTVKIFSVLFFQAVFSVVFHNTMSLDKSTNEVINSIDYNKKVALRSFLSIIGILFSLLFIYLF